MPFLLCLTALARSSGTVGAILEAVCPFPLSQGKRSGRTAVSEDCQWLQQLPFIRARKALPSHFAKFSWRLDLEFYLSSFSEDA